MTRTIQLDGTTPEDLADEMYDALPEGILVGVAAAMLAGDGSGFTMAAKNVKE